MKITKEEKQRVKKLKEFITKRCDNTLEIDVLVLLDKFKEIWGEE